MALIQSRSSSTPNIRVSILNGRYPQKRVSFNMALLKELGLDSHLKNGILRVSADTDHNSRSVEFIFGEQGTHKATDGGICYGINQLPIEEGSYMPELIVSDSRVSVKIVDTSYLTSTSIDDKSKIVNKVDLPQCISTLSISNITRESDPAMLMQTLASLYLSSSGGENRTAQGFHWFLMLQVGLMPKAIFEKPANRGGNAGRIDAFESDINVLFEYKSCRRMARDRQEVVMLEGFQQAKEYASDEGFTPKAIVVADVGNRLDLYNLIDGNYVKLRSSLYIDICGASAERAFLHDFLIGKNSVS